MARLAGFVVAAIDLAVVERRWASVAARCSWGFVFGVALPHALRKVGQYAPWHMRELAWLGLPGLSLRRGRLGRVLREFFVYAGAPAPPRRNVHHC